MRFKGKSRPQCVKSYFRAVGLLSPLFTGLPSAVIASLADAMVRSSSTADKLVGLKSKQLAVRLDDVDAFYAKLQLELVISSELRTPLAAWHAMWSARAAEEMPVPCSDSGHPSAA